ncbi:zinc-ribbon domain-containing protein [Clostridium psychrophilum]|uniref:zinc-ribbon domain-containing protein n=1 Tax=Clostridium psychrophilum TaxID=132926 RepID=UPI001C0CFD33|nr:zinc ribbon domain-containing protein [Clostridium psychrophilum]MBU3180830.1 zinc-ribbon domain-containing protein [Clostridium psychrophilum]
MYCSECGNKNIEGAKYCFKCGIILENKKAVNDENDNVGVEEVVANFKATNSSNKKIGAKGLKHKPIISQKKQITISIFVFSIIVVIIASVVGVFIYENTH